MEVDKVKKALDNYLDDKLRSPYFAAVAVVWIVSNRVLIFGLFNFDHDMLLEAKILWIHQQFQSFNIGLFQGFFGVTLWSFIWGFVAMVSFNLIDAVGKTLFKRVNNISILMLQKVDPPKWVSKKYFDQVKETSDDHFLKTRELQSDLDQVNVRNQEYVDQIADITSQLKEAQKVVSEKSLDIDKLKSTHETKIKSLNKKISRQDGQVAKLKEEIQDLKIEASMPKYELNDKSEILTPADFFSGKWLNEYQFHGQKNWNSEYFTVVEPNKYMLGNEHIYDIIDFKANNDEVTFRKVSPKGDSFITVRLNLTSVDVLEGIEIWSDQKTKAIVKYSHQD